MDQPLPYDIPAERAVLGCCLMDREVILGVRQLVASSDFYLEKHAHIYEACLSCFEQKIPPDVFTVSSTLKDRGLLDAIGGITFLGELMQEQVTYVHAPHYARTVARMARQRRLVEHLGSLMASAYTNDPDKVLEEAEHRLDLERMTGALSDDWQDQVADGADIWQKEYTPRPFIVDGILPAGITLLHGLPKTNKSWLCKGLCYAVAQGGKALGHLQADRGEALYLNLEMDEELLNERLKVMFPEGPPPRGVKFFCDWPTIDNGFFSRLENYVTARPYTKLVIVDTLVRVFPLETKDGYRADARLIEPFTKFNANRGLSILLVHHSRKLSGGNDPILGASGSTGITGSVDSILELVKDPEEPKGKLMRVGRRIRDNAPLPLKWDSLLGQWCVSEQPARMTPERMAVLDLLEEHGPLSPKKVSALLERPAASVRRLLNEMHAARLVSNMNGIYALNEESLMA
ncbi:AAA family ATPase [Candidatus Chloroploca asiatica]|nr:DnaB-like helicase N-terminal domain-containing protein [Candidatus Chloroploca asiatica]